MDILYKNMIQAFIDKKAWFTDAGLPTPKLIDYYMGQPEHPDEFEFALPAVFMDYSIQWKKAGKIYEGSPVIEFHCIPPDEYPSASSISSRRDDGLKTILWYQTVAQVLDTVTTDHSTGLVRINERPAITRDFNYHIMGYGCEIDALPGTEHDRYQDGTINDIAIAGNIVSKFSL